MRLLCHDVECEGHDLPAGSDPDGCCRFCSRPFVDRLGVLLVENITSRGAIRTDLIAVGICSVHDHVWEGVVRLVAGELHGSCARCGLLITLPIDP